MTFYLLVFIVILNAVAIITLWRAAARRPPKPKKQFIAALLHSKPILPKHRPPKVIGEAFTSLVSEEDRKFFKDFEDFADVVNWWFADEHVGTRWRLQELPDTDLKHHVSDMPHFGRRYDVFHNQVQVGTLEVSPDSLAEKRSVYTSIQLEWVRLLPIYTIREFLDGIALHVCETNPTTKEYAQARAAIEGCLTDALWQTQQISEFDVDQGYGELELNLNGSLVWYFQRRQAPAFKRQSVL
jgi:hypothetical protein